VVKAMLYRASSHARAYLQNAGLGDFKGCLELCFGLVGSRIGNSKDRRMDSLLMISTSFQHNQKNPYRKFCLYFQSFTYQELIARQVPAPQKRYFE
jgi:hypothetical protein